MARWINHSCKPNCEAVIEENPKGKAHKDKVFIEAIRAIQPGEELTYNYGITLDEPHNAKVKNLWGCKCGMQNSTAPMLQPKRRSDERRIGEQSGRPYRSRWPPES